MKRFLPIILSLLSCICYGQQVPPATVLSVNEGLSQGMVFDIIQSREGYIWIATKDGLNRYDGYRFKIYSPDPFDPFSIAASEAWHLFEDSKGRIWVFYAGGIDVLVPETGHFFHVPKSLLSGFEFSPDYIACRVAESGDGSIWVTEKFRLWSIKIPGDMLARAEKEGNAYPAFEVSRIQATNSAGLPEKFTSVYYSASRQLLVGTFSGLFNLDAATQKLTPAALPNYEIYILGVDKREHIFLSGPVPPDAGTGTIHVGNKTAGPSDWMVWAIEPGKTQPWFSTFSHASFKFDRQGNLWTYTIKEVSNWRPDSFTNGGHPEFEWVTSEAIAHSAYFKFAVICIDRSGIIWIGTNGYGLRKIVPQQPKFSSYLPLTSQRRIFEDPSGLLICAEKPEWAFTTRNFSSFIKNPWFKDPSFLTQGVFVFDESGHAWISNQSEQLLKVHKQSGAVQRFNWNAWGLEMDRGQVLFGVNASGLMAFDSKTGQSKQFPFDEPQRLQAAFWHIHYLHLAPNGVIWIFGFEGLIKASPSEHGYRFTYYRNNPADRTSLSNDFVCSVADDPVEPETYLWVGTKGGGLNRLNIKTGEFKHYRTAEGLPDNVVYSILSENNAPGKPARLWMSTNKGLSRFDIGAGQFKNFIVADGLQSNEFNLGSYLKTRDGHLVFGGINGLTIFHPDSLSFNPAIPQIRIVGIEINNQPFESFGQTRLNLAYNQNFLNLSFSALEFTNPGQNQYRYQLTRKRLFGKTGEETWIELREKNTVLLADLQPGHYTFKVMGSNNDGNWSSTPAVLELVIQPPWWATWWAFALYLAFAGGLAIFLYRNKLKRKLEQQEARRLRELDDFKNRFFTNITHEFRTPLTVILGTTEHLAADIGKWAVREEKAAVKSKLNLVKRNGENLLRLINQILDLAKLESNTLKINYVQGDVLAYLRYIVESLHSLANAQNVLLRVESTEPELVMDYDPERLLQIVHNLLSNAIKFTPSGGQVVLRLTVESGQMAPSGVGAPQKPSGLTAVISVSDTGAGIPPDELPFLFDRFFQAKNQEHAKAGGAGIGLSLTKELVRAMNGGISVESPAPGSARGAVFTVRLPVTQKAATITSPRFGFTEGLPGHAPDRPSPTGIGSPEAFLPWVSAEAGRNGSPGVGALILLIEDNPDVVEYLGACLAVAYRLDFAYNGRAGIEKALEIVPDLIISDVMMPEKDGFEVVETLKNDERTSHIPIVLLTAKAGVENRIAGLRRGADAYLAKPFHEEELLVTLAGLLDGRRKLQARFAAPGFPATETSGATATRPKSETDLEDVFISKVKNAVFENLSNSSFSVDDLCRTLAMSQPQLHRKLTALTNKNATLFIRTIRLAKAKELLLEKAMNVSEVAYAVGFDDPKYFSRVFAEEFGVLPSKI